MELKRYITAILIAVMLFYLIPIPPFVEAATPSHTDYNSCTEPDPVKTTSTSTLDQKFSEIQSQLPPGTPKIVKGLYLNFRLWHDKNILVYGNYSSIAQNDFDNK